MAIKLMSRMEFFHRILRHASAALLLIVFSLLLGAVGYHWTAGLGWMDSFLNASMILTGMGPVATLTTPGAKLFAMLYALYSGVFFLSLSAVLLYPFVHRMLKRLHIQAGDDSGAP